MDNVVVEVELVDMDNVVVEVELVDMDDVISVVRMVEEDDVNKLKSFVLLIIKFETMGLNVDDDLMLVDELIVELIFG
jgi:hypothetical protein